MCSLSLKPDPVNVSSWCCAADSTLRMELVSKHRRIAADVKQAAIALVFLVGFIGDTHRDKESDDKVIVTLKFPSLSVSLSPLRFPVTFKSLRLTERQIVTTDIACTMCGTISTAGHDDLCFDDDKCQHVLCGSTCMWAHQLTHHSISRIDWLRFCCGMRLPLRYDLLTRCEFLGIAQDDRKSQSVPFEVSVSF